MVVLAMLLLVVVFVLVHGGDDGYVGNNGESPCQS